MTDQPNLNAVGWVVVACDCGEQPGQFPDFVTAVDGLLDHICGAVIAYA